MNRLVFMWGAQEFPWQIRLIVPDHVEIEFFDADQIYPSGTVFYYDLYGPYHDTIITHLNQGHKVIFDAKNEHYVHHNKRWILDEFVRCPGQGCFVISGARPDLVPGVTIVATPYWYWILDQMNLMNFKIHEHQRNWNIQRKFFMTLGLCRHERDYLWDRLGSLLDDSLHSCRYKNIFLPDDYHDYSIGQRYINPQWLDSTAFTLAVETYIDETATTGYSLTLDNRYFLCEKTYKPLAAQHPLLMVGTPGNLSYLRSQGFETFPELFDESYDLILDWQQRINRIVEIVRDFDVKSVDQPQIKEKMRYNQAHFFNQQLTKKYAEETIQQPVFEFVNA